jgi:hypothetical protein
MRYLKIIVGCITILLCAAVLTSAQDSSALKIAISTPHLEFKAGSEIPLTISQKNISAKDLLVYGNGRTEINFTIKVLDEQQKEPPLTDYYYTLRYGHIPIAGSRTFGMLKPNKTFDETIVLNKLYILDKPGKYSIQVSKVRGGKKEILSNIVTITLN